MFRAESAEPEACFIEEALQYISERESGLGDRHLPALAEELQEEQVIKPGKTYPSFCDENFQFILVIIINIMIKWFYYYAEHIVAISIC